MNITNLDKGRSLRLALVPALALAMAALSPFAHAGTYSAQLVGYSGTPTVTGVATIGLSGLTSSWDIVDGYNLVYGSQSDYSQAIGTAQWKVTWTPSYVGETPPATCSARIAPQLAQYVQTDAECEDDTCPGSWGAHSLASDTLGMVMDISSHLGAGAGDDYHQQGSTTPSHCAYYDHDTSFNLDANGNYVAYIGFDFSAYTMVSSSAANAVPSGTGPQPVLYHGAGLSSAIIHGKARLIVVNGVQIGNDFSGGTYATSGFSN